MLLSGELSARVPEDVRKCWIIGREPSGCLFATILAVRPQKSPSPLSVFMPAAWDQHSKSFCAQLALLPLVTMPARARRHFAGLPHNSLTRQVIVASPLACIRARRDASEAKRRHVMSRLPPGLMHNPAVDIFSLSRTRQRERCDRRCNYHRSPHEYLVQRPQRRLLTSVGIL